MKVIGYVRVSSQTQVDKGSGLDVQERQIRRWAKSQGHRVMAIYTDAGVSGSNGVEDREGLPEALAALRDGDAEGLVVAKLDRLARSLTVQEAVLAKVWQLGGTAYAVDTGEILADDPADPMRTAMRQMVGVFAELERRVIAKRMRDGRQHKADQGGYAGGRPPYGWRAEGGALGEDKAEQATIRRARELRADGLSLRQTADRLAAEGLTNRQGGTWHSAALGRVLDR